MVYHHTDDSFQDASNEEEEEGGFPTAPLDDDIWLEEPVPVRHLCIHEKSQPKLPVFLSLSLQPGSATTHFRRHPSIILWDNGPQWHLRFPRCDDNHQQWRHPWFGWCFWTLNMNYGLDKYSLNSLQINYHRNVKTQQNMFINTKWDHQNLWMINT